MAVFLPKFSMVKILKMPKFSMKKPRRGMAGLLCDEDFALFCLVSVWLYGIGERSFHPVELVEAVGLGGIERLEGRFDMRDDGKVEILDSHDHHLGDFVCSVGVEVGVVLEGFHLSRVCVSRIVDE